MVEHVCGRASVPDSSGSSGDRGTSDDEGCCLPVTQPRCVPQTGCLLPRASEALLRAGSLLPDPMPFPARCTELTTDINHVSLVLFVLVCGVLQGFDT